MSDHRSGRGRSKETAKSPEGLSFTNSKRLPVKWEHPQRHVAGNSGSAGIPSGMGSTSWRHYYASLLIRHARLGYAAAVQTLGTYSHLWPEVDDPTRAAVGTSRTYPPASGGR